MRRTCRVAVAGLAGCVVAAAGVVLGAAGIARAASTTPVPGSAAPAGVLVGPVPASRQLTVQVWLAPDLAGAAAFADAVSTPGSPEFRHYLSPDAYTARFAPSAARTRAVTRWLTAEGLTRVHADAGRDYVSATGPASNVRSAVRVPSSLAPDVLAVTGLAGTRPAGTGPDSAAPPAAKQATCSRYWGQHVQRFHPAYHRLTRGSLPVCGYSAAQIRAAYGATTAATGKGETVALIEQTAPVAMPQTLKDYARRNHLPAPRAGQFRERIDRAGSGGCGAVSPAAAQGSYDVESQMDSEAVYAMAPGASQLMVVAAGCNQNQSLLDSDLSVLTGNGHHPSASIESNSWQIPLGQVSPKAVHAIDLRAAAEGVGMYFSSGDGPGLNTTDSDPYAIAVGGTTLGIGAKDNRLFETGWSDDYTVLSGGKWSDEGVSLGASGGTSLVYRQPAYQKGVVPASMSRVRVGKRVVTDRAVPDIAADADPASGLLIGYIRSESKGRPGPYQTTENAGTSLACPLVAGLVADAQEGQKSAFGFLNPVIYRLAGTRALRDILPVTAAMPQQDRDAYLPDGGLNSPALYVFDAQERSYTKQVTAKGYDTMTGVGAPNGAAFIAALRHA